MKACPKIEQFVMLDEKYVLLIILRIASYKKLQLQVQNSIQYILEFATILKPQIVNKSLQRSLPQISPHCYRLISHMWRECYRLISIFRLFFLYYESKGVLKMGFYVEYFRYFNKHALN